MSDKQTIDMLKALIKEVKEEKKTLKEGKEKVLKGNETISLKEYITKNLMETIRDSGD